MPRTKKIDPPPEPPRDERFAEQKLEIIGVILIGLTLLATIAVYFHGAGFIGEILKRGLFFTFGSSGVILPIIFLGISGWWLMVWRERLRLGKHFVALMMVFVLALLVMHLCSGVELTDDNWPAAAEGAGVIGHFLALTLLNWFGRLGTIIFALLWLTVAVILVLDRPLAEVVKGMLRKRPLESRSEPAYSTEVAATQYPVQTEPYQEIASEAVAPNVIAFPSKKAPSNSVISTLQEMLREKEKAKTSQKIEPSKSESNQPKLKLVSGAYKLPDLNLLGPFGVRQKKSGRILTDQSRKLEETLASFGVQARVIEVHHGPVITRYDLQPAPGVKVSRVVNLTDDLSLALAAKGLRLEAPIPGKAAIGIEVPNHEAQVVTFRDVLDSKIFWNSGKLSFALGMDIAGEIMVADLKRMPHLLIAGATGSGKSVCVNTLVMSILFKACPEEVKFIMIDPKMVELSIYNGIPHLMAPVVTESKRAAGVLKIVVDEMERRYKLFAEARVREIEKYNESLPGAERLPYIIVLIDELADLMMVAPVEVEDAICRLAQMARATGIHLVVATQRPSVDVITGLIKANIPSRIAFAVSSQVDSRTILDSVGAERLLGRGDMLFSPVGSMKPRRVQGALVGEKEIEAVIQHWKEQGAPQYQDQFTNIPDPKSHILVDEDELFWDAARIVVDHGQASASVIQRRLRVGYTRAARLIDMLEAKGMVGPYEGSKPREVYITTRQLEELRQRSEE